MSYHPLGNLCLKGLYEILLIPPLHSLRYSVPVEVSEHVLALVSGAVPSVIFVR